MEGTRAALRVFLIGQYVSEPALTETLEKRVPVCLPTKIKAGSLPRISKNKDLCVLGDFQIFDPTIFIELDGRDRSSLKGFPGFTVLLGPSAFENTEKNVTTQSVSHRAAYPNTPEFQQFCEFLIPPSLMGSMEGLKVFRSKSRKELSPPGPLLSKKLKKSIGTFSFFLVPPTRS